MNKESLDKMNRMRLLGMHHAFEDAIETKKMNTFTNDELVHHLVQSEWDDRQYRSLQRGLKNANFRYKANIEQLDYTEDRGLDKNLYSGCLIAVLLKKAKICLLQAAPALAKASLHQP